MFVDVRENGWNVSKKTVADAMRRQGLVARVIKRRRGVTKQDMKAAKFPDVVRRDFTASRINEKWVGDITEIPTASGKLYQAPDAELACAAIRMAAAVRGGKDAIAGVIFHTVRGSTYTATDFTRVCVEGLGIRQSLGRVGSCFDNAAAEAFFSTLEWEVLSRNVFRDPAHAREVVLEWCHDFYNTTRRHSNAKMMSPINYEASAALESEAA